MRESSFLMREFIAYSFSWCRTVPAWGRSFPLPLARRLSPRGPREGRRTGRGIRNRHADERIRRTGPCRCLVPFDLHRPELAKGPGCLPRVTLGPPGTGCLHLVSEV